MFRRVSVPCVRWSRLCSAGSPCPACVGLDYVPQGLRALRALVSTMFRRMASAFVPCVRCSRLCSAGWLRLSCPACVALDYVPQDLRLSCPACVALDYVPQGGFGFRALRALLSTMFRRVSVPCVRCSRLCSAGSPCPACVQVRTGTKVSEAIHPNSVLMRKS